MDKADSGKENVFSKFKPGDHTIHKVLVNPGFKSDLYKDYAAFKDVLLGAMEKGWAVEKQVDTPEGYERGMEEKFKVVVEDIKQPEGHLIKLVHSPTKEGVFLENVFKMTDNDFFGHLPLPPPLRGNCFPQPSADCQTENRFCHISRPIHSFP